MKKIIPYKKASLTGRVLRLLGMNRDLEQPLSDQEEIVRVGVPASNYHTNRKEIEAALLEAERRKAEAIEWQRHRLIC